MKKISKFDRRRKRSQLRPTAAKIDRSWEKLAKEVEADENAAAIPTPTTAKSKSGKKSKASGPKKSVSYGLTLKSCDTVDKAAGFAAKSHRRFAKKAIKAVRRRNISEGRRSVLDGLLSKPEATSVCIMTNPRLVTDLHSHLHKALVDLSQVDPPGEMALVTLIAGDCETSTDQPVIDLHGAQTRAKSTLRAMAKNFIGITEFVMFNSIPHADGGTTMNHHEHAIVFGDLRKAERAAFKHRKRYPPNCTGADPIKITRITDRSEANLARVAAYLLKAPHKAINYRPPMNGKKSFLNKSEKCDRMIRYLRMAQLRTTVTFEDCCYAGGKGIEARKKLVSLMRAFSKSDASTSQRLVHPDAIPTFWVELAKELKRDKWALPIVKRRP